MELTETQRESLTEWCSPLAEDLGLEFVGVDLVSEEGQKILRVTIDHLDGITVGHCATISRKLSLILDVEDLFPFEYNLEVSSPGIFRVLKNEAEMERFMGYRVKAYMASERDQDGKKHKREIVGELNRVESESIYLQSESKEIGLERNRITKIHLFPKF